MPSAAAQVLACFSLWQAGQVQQQAGRQARRQAPRQAPRVAHMSFLASCRSSRQGPAGGRACQDVPGHAWMDWAKQRRRALFGARLAPLAEPGAAQEAVRLSAQLATLGPGCSLAAERPRRGSPPTRLLSRAEMTSCSVPSQEPTKPAWREAGSENTEVCKGGSRAGNEGSERQPAQPAARRPGLLGGSLLGLTLACCRAPLDPVGQRVGAAAGPSAHAQVVGVMEGARGGHCRGAVDERSSARHLQGWVQGDTISRLGRAK